MKEYPNPCDTCKHCTAPNGCIKWRIRYLRKQKMINAFAKRLWASGGKSPDKQQKFCYEHPDIVRRYIQRGPCAGCRFEKTCDIPCGAYWNWWDARMEWMKVVFGK